MNTIALVPALSGSSFVVKRHAKTSAQTFSLMPAKAFKATLGNKTAAEKKEAYNEYVRKNCQAMNAGVAAALSTGMGYVTKIRETKKGWVANIEKALPLPKARVSEKAFDKALATLANARGVSVETLRSQLAAAAKPDALLKTL